MKSLFNSKGQHIANEVNNHLHAPMGKNIGHYLMAQNIYIDMHGKYLGEIVQGNRLLFKKTSPYKGQVFGNPGNYGNAGSLGNPGMQPSIGVVVGFEDIPSDRLQG